MRQSYNGGDFENTGKSGLMVKLKTDLSKIGQIDQPYNGQEHD